MSALATAFARHLWARLTALTRDWAALVTVVGMASVTLAVWNLRSPLMAFGVDPDDPFSVFIWVFWLWTWPAVPMAMVAGRTTGSTSVSLGLRAMPALPVGARTRAAAECTLVLGAALAAQIVYAVVSGDRDALGTGVYGAAVLLPTTLAWGLPATSVNLAFLRPAVVAVAVAVCGLAGGLTSPLTASLTGLGLAVLTLLAGGRREPSLRLPRRRSTPDRRWRPALEPLARLRRDTWALPWRDWGWPSLAAVALLAAAAVLDGRGRLPGWWFFGAFEIVLVIVLQPLLRPLGSTLLAMSMSGKHGVRLGDMARAWALLPLAPERVLRRIWLHAFTIAGGLWLLGLAAIATRSWLRFGELGLRDGDGSPIGFLVLPFGALAVMLPGALVAIAAGDRRWSIVGGVSLLFVIHAFFLLRVLLEQLAGESSPLVPTASLTLLLVFTALAALPPLRHLRSDRLGAGSA